MGQIVNSPYLEIRNGAYYIVGSAVSLASVVHAFRQGASPETILQDFPQIGALAKVYGAIIFILENSEIIEEYLAGPGAALERIGKAISTTAGYGGALREGTRIAKAEASLSLRFQADADFKNSAVVAVTRRWPFMTFDPHRV